jgi:hypothetical protein
MQGTEIERRYAAFDERQNTDEYNFEHFRTGILLEDGQRTIEARGILPGEMAPDFELPQTGGGTLRLSDLRGRPTILHFGSFS